MHDFPVERQAESRLPHQVPRCFRVELLPGTPNVHDKIGPYHRELY